ncbi:MAG: hypothetical protein LBL59_08040 [Xanthomonadaceae bacterium]|nr:hypothetical protein [Xanthomonadaceae bacterium]
MSIRLSVFALILAALAADFVHAQDHLAMGRKINGPLSENDRVSDDGSRSHDYGLRLAGQGGVVGVRSRDFDTGVGLYDKAGRLVSENDGGDSLLIVPISESGEYTVRIRSFNTSAFTLKASGIDND